jgi:NHL repeat
MKEEKLMWLSREIKFALGFAVVAAFAMSGDKSYAQGAPDPNAAPNPYRLDEGWAKLPEGRKFGAFFGLSVDRDGQSLWAFDRCASPDFCADSNLAPIFKFDRTGKTVANFGAGMFASPHGLYADGDGNIWATDFRGKNGKGHTVTKFSPDGKVLMTLGKPGVPGNGQDTFNAPSNTLVAPNGDIFVADGHGGDTNARIVKFTKDGKFIKAWGTKGTAPGQFDTPHMLAMDSAGRLFVADRVNNRIQIFDQDGQFLDEWKQFGRPSGIYINKNDTMYVSDSQSDAKTNPGFGQGIRIGTVKDKKVTAYIPETKELGALEGVASDAAGNVYAGYTNTMNLRRFVKKDAGL